MLFPFVLMGKWTKLLLVAPSRGHVLHRVTDHIVPNIHVPAKVLVYCTITRVTNPINSFL